MTILASLRTGLAANVSTVTGLACTATIPADIAPPFAMVLPTSKDFHGSFGTDFGEYAFTVRVLVGLPGDTGAQLLLDDYLATSGTTSVKAAIESDRTLGGYADDLQVLRWSNYGVFQMNESTYLGAEFSVQVFAL